jgi:hypothetical protein
MQILTYIGLAIGIISLVFGIIKSHKLIKNPLNEIDYKSELKPIVYGGLAFVLGILLTSIGLFDFIKDEVLWYEYLLGILGGILLSSSLYLFVTTFMIHYYRKGLPTLLDKWLFRI